MARVTKEIEAKILEMFKDGVEIHKIGYEVGINKRTVFRYLKKNNVESRKGKMEVKIGQIIGDLEILDKNNKICTCKCLYKGCGKVFELKQSELFRSRRLTFMCMECCRKLSKNTLEDKKNKKPKYEPKTIRKISDMKDIVIKLYVEDRYTLDEVAFIVNFDASSVTKCLNKHGIKMRDNVKDREGTEIAPAYLSSIKKGASDRNILFDITRQQMWELFLKQDRKCALSGQELYFAKYARKDDNQNASLDRIDSSIGYIPSNIQWLCKHVNKAKHIMSQNRFLELCDKITNFDGIYTENIILLNGQRDVDYYNISHSFLCILRGGAKKRYFNFDITIKDIWDLYEKQHGQCALSGEKIEFVLDYHKNRGLQTASVDRIDSSIGYYPSNIQIVNRQVNMMKLTHSNEFFKNLCKMVSKHCKSKQKPETQEIEQPKNSIIIP